MFKNVRKAECFVCGETKEIYDKILGKDVCSKCYDTIPHRSCESCEHSGFCKYEDSIDVCWYNEEMEEKFIEDLIKKKESSKNDFKAVGWVAHPILVEFSTAYQEELKKLKSVVEWRSFAANLFDVKREYPGKDGKVKFDVKLNVPFHGNGGIEAYSGESKDGVTIEEVEQTFNSVLAEKLKKPYVESYTIVDLGKWMEGKKSDRCKIVVK